MPVSHEATRALLRNAGFPGGGKNKRIPLTGSNDNGSMNDANSRAIMARLDAIERRNAQKDRQREKAASTRSSSMDRRSAGGGRESGSFVRSYLRNRLDDTISSNADLRALRSMYRFGKDFRDFRRERRQDGRGRSGSILPAELPRPQPARSKPLKKHDPKFTVSPINKDYNFTVPFIHDLDKGYGGAGGMGGIGGIGGGLKKGGRLGRLGKLWRALRGGMGGLLRGGLGRLGIGALGLGGAGLAGLGLAGIAGLNYLDPGHPRSGGGAGNPNRRYGGRGGQGSTGGYGSQGQRAAPSTLSWPSTGSATGATRPSVAGTPYKWGRTPTSTQAAPSGGLKAWPGQDGVEGGLTSLAADRAKFRQELADNPGLRNKIMRIAANEQGRNPQGTQAVIESMMNRASYMGTSLSHQARWTGERGYYAMGNMGRGALENKEHRAILERGMSNALGGSNVAKYATDNASGKWGQNRIDKGMYHFASTYGGELFSTPGWGPGAGNQRKYANWRANMEKGQPIEKDGSMPNIGSMAPGVNSTFASSNIPFDKNVGPGQSYSPPPGMINTPSGPALASQVGSNAGQIPGIPALGKITNTVGAKMDRVDPRLVNVGSEAARIFARENPGYTAEVLGPSSGVRYSGSTHNHGIQANGYGGAIDFGIRDPKGNLMANRGNAPGSDKVFPYYAQLHRNAKIAQAALYPKMKLGSGFAFDTSRGSGQKDWQHLDITHKNYDWSRDFRNGRDSVPGFRGDDLQRAVQKEYGSNPQLGGLQVQSLREQQNKQVKEETAQPKQPTAEPTASSPQVQSNGDMYGFKGLRGQFNQEAFESYARSKNYNPVTINASKPSEAAAEAIKVSQQRGKSPAGMYGYSLGNQSINKAIASGQFKDLKEVTSVAAFRTANLRAIEKSGAKWNNYPDKSSLGDGLAGKVRGEGAFLSGRHSEVQAQLAASMPKPADTSQIPAQAKGPTPTKANIDKDTAGSPSQIQGMVDLATANHEGTKSPIGIKPPTPIDTKKSSIGKDEGIKKKDFSSVGKVASGNTTVKGASNEGSGVISSPETKVSPPSSDDKKIQEKEAPPPEAAKSEAASDDKKASSKEPTGEAGAKSDKEASGGASVGEGEKASGEAKAGEKESEGGDKGKGEKEGEASSPSTDKGSVKEGSGKGDEGGGKGEEKSSGGGKGESKGGSDGGGGKHSSSSGGSGSSSYGGSSGQGGGMLGGLLGQLTGLLPPQLQPIAGLLGGLLGGGNPLQALTGMLPGGMGQMLGGLLGGGSQGGGAGGLLGGLLGGQGGNPLGSMFGGGAEMGGLGSLLGGQGGIGNLLGGLMKGDAGTGLGNLLGGGSEQGWLGNTSLGGFGSSGGPVNSLWNPSTGTQGFGNLGTPTGTGGFGNLDGGGGSTSPWQPTQSPSAFPENGTSGIPNQNMGGFGGNGFGDAASPMMGGTGGLGGQQPGGGFGDLLGGGTTRGIMNPGGSSGDASSPMGNASAGPLDQTNSNIVDQAFDPMNFGDPNTGANPSGNVNAPLEAAAQPAPTTPQEGGQKTSLTEMNTMDEFSSMIGNGTGGL